MTKNKTVNIFLLDDEFPTSKEFIENQVYARAISSDELYHLSISENWGALHFLQELIKDIVASAPCKNGLIRLLGFKNPNIALDEIEKKQEIPDVVIFDWEYGMPNPTESQSFLLELLEKTQAFIFVYSKVRNEIPQFLNKSVFNPYAKRLQLFLKGSTSHSIFSSEEFILQYILGKVSNNVSIKIQGFPVEFEPNELLKHASDILYLERIVGKLYLLEELKKIQFNITSYTVENLLNDTHGFVYINKQKGLLVSPDENAIIAKMPQLEQLSYAQVAKDYSIYKLEETLEKGTALINLSHA